MHYGSNKALVDADSETGDTYSRDCRQDSTGSVHLKGVTPSALHVALESQREKKKRQTKIVNHE